MEKFFDYFDGRYRESILNKPPADDGPVITLSRLTGCDARQVAALLVDKLNSKYGTIKFCCRIVFCNWSATGSLF